MTDAAGTAAAPDVTAAPDVGADPTAAAGGQFTTPTVPYNSLSTFTIRNIDIGADNQDGGASGTITMTDDKPDKGVSDVPPNVPDNSPNVKVVVVSKLQVSCSHGAFPCSCNKIALLFKRKSSLMYCMTEMFSTGCLTFNILSI